MNWVYGVSFMEKKKKWISQEGEVGFGSCFPHEKILDILGNIGERFIETIWTNCASQNFEYFFEEYHTLHYFYVILDSLMNLTILFWSHLDKDSLVQKFLRYGWKIQWFKLR